MTLSTRTKVLILIACIVFAFTASGRAQETATKTSKLAWSEPASTLADANSYTYTAYVDADPGKALVATCTDVNSPVGYECVAAFPPLTPGVHTLVLTAKLGDAESDRSGGLIARMVVIQTPTGLRIVTR